VRLADTHAHLNDDQFDFDRAAALQRARAAGVQFLLDVGADRESSERAVALAEAEPDVWAAVGVHPHDARSLDEVTWERIAELAAHPRVVAVGETGLDFYRNLSPPVAQREAFRRHMQLAERAGKALVVHSRQADVETVEELRRCADRVPVVLHCFSGGEDMLREAIGLGVWVSFAGNVTYPKAAALLQLAPLVPADRLLVETDCPYLAPAPRRGRRNEPAYVAHTLAAVAEARGVAAEELAEITFHNAEVVFGLAQ